MSFTSFSKLSSLNTIDTSPKWKIINIKDTDENNTWNYIDSSSDGTKMIMSCGIGDKVFRSKNSGISWYPMNETPSENWRTVCSSADGNILLIASYPGCMYMSTNENTWTKVAVDTSRNWHSIKKSEDGSKMIACAISDMIYVSNNQGVSWTQQSVAGNAIWVDVAISNDGTKLFGSNSTSIIFSINSGSTWNRVNNTDMMCYSINLFNNGNSLIVAQEFGSIWRSDNTSTLQTVGLTKVTSLPTDAQWRSTATSSDGKIMVVGDLGSVYGIYISTNYGNSWSQQIPTINYPHLFILLVKSKIYSPVLGSNKLFIYS
jgi:photosystem II stability/assembly factor-like uncharacterized protein